MTSTPELRSNELTVAEFYDALNATDKEYMAMSWGGFNLFGDRLSIKELSRLQWKESFIKPLQNRLDEYMAETRRLEDRIDELETRLKQYEAK
jgi:hypothetical protein